MPIASERPEPNGDNRPSSEPSKQQPEMLLKTLKQWWTLDGPHAKKWRDGDATNIGAKDALDFVAGRMWTDDEVSYLKSQMRAPVTFNRVLPTISSVVGIEINSRHETVYIPTAGSQVDERGRIRVKANEALSQASHAFADKCDAEDHQSEAFRDGVITGMGWTEARVDYDEDPTGKYIEQVCNPLEFAWDYRAREKNLADSQRRWHLRPMPLHEAMSLFPEEDINDLDAVWAVAETGAGKSHVDDYGRSRDEDVGDRDLDTQSTVNILRCQWIEYEKIWTVASPMNPAKPQQFSDDEFTSFREQWDAQKSASEAAGVPFAATYKAVRGRRKVFKEAYIGSKILGEVRPPQFPGGFTFNCITGIPDRNRGHWFGLVSVMRDPQKWANAWLSQTQHILNSTAKGGIIAETDAFDDQRQAEKTYARPDAITWASPGAIKQGKIMQKPGVGISAGHANLMEFAVSSIRDVTGINLEILGLRDANQPGILEAQRKQAAMTILAPWFDSLRRFRKQIGRVRLYYIQELLSGPDRMIRIVGEDGYELIPLMRQNVIGEYDIEVSDAPSSPNQKEQQWQVLQTIVPLFADEIKQSPEAAIWVLRQSPLHSKAVDELQAIINKPKPEQIKQQQVAERGAQAEVEKTESETQRNVAGAFKDKVTAVVDLIQAHVTQQQVTNEGVMAEADASRERQNERKQLIEGDAPAIEAIMGGPMLQGQTLQPPPLVPSGPDLPQLPVQTEPMLSFMNQGNIPQ